MMTLNEIRKLRGMTLSELAGSQGCPRILHGT